MLDIIENSSKGLAQFLHIALQQKLESIRLARVGYVLFTSGCSTNGNFPGNNLSSYLVSNQQLDGGWADVEETAWCLAYLKAFGDRYQQEIIKGREWLASIQLPCGAWGKSGRDQPRIPITALVANLVPEVASESTFEWISKKWEEDLNSPTQLTYKGALFLLANAYSKAPHDNTLTSHTINYLIEEQEEDGGFSPWKGHPVGSDPWSTGVALWGLSTFAEQVPGNVIERAVSWLESRQLSNGLWPYHFMDDGASMALIGISSVLPLLSEQ